jgi:hypothetical protein
VPAELLTDDITEEYIRHWIAEADARHEEIYSRPGWLKWGIESGYVPPNHPQLRRRSEQPRPSSAGSRSAIARVADIPQPACELDDDLHALWQAVLKVLEVNLTRNEFETWIKPCQLVALEPGTTVDETTLAIIATPNIFVRQEVGARYQDTLTAALGVQVGQSVEVQCVIGAL